MKYLIILMFLTGCATNKPKDFYKPRFKSASCYMSEGVKFGVMNIGTHKSKIVYNIYVVSGHGVKKFYWASAEKFDNANIYTSRLVRCE